MSDSCPARRELLAAAEANYASLSSIAGSLPAPDMDNEPLYEKHYPELYATVDALPDAQLEALYYVGLRPLTVGIAEHLQDQALKQQVIDRASEHMVTLWNTQSRETSLSGLAISDLSVSGGGDHIYNIASDVYDSQPIGTRLVADMATIAVSMRRYRIVSEREVGLRTEVIGRPSSPHASFHMMRYEAYRPSADRVGINGLAASNLVLRAVLTRLYEQQYPEHSAHIKGVNQAAGAEEKLFMRIADTIDPAALRALDLDYVGRRSAATVRLDWLKMGEVSRLIDVDNQGKPVFNDAQRLRQSQLDQPDPTVRLAYDIFRCPAVFSELIPITLDIVKAVAVQAETQAQKLKADEKPFYARILHRMRHTSTVWARAA